MAEHQVLFCPFCRESFEGADRCPEHELSLVPFHRLAPDSSLESELVGPDEDTPLATLEPGYGRGLVGLGALGNALALMLPFVRFPDDTALSTFALATVLPSLWTLALSSFTLLFMLRRRRTLRALQGLRVLVPALACASPASVFWALGRVQSGGALLLTRVRSPDVQWGSAVYVTLVAALLIAVGGARLGVASAATRKR